MWRRKGSNESLSLYFCKELFCFSMKQLVLSWLCARLASPVASPVGESQRREAVVIHAVCPCDAQFLRCGVGPPLDSLSVELLCYLLKELTVLALQHLFGAFELLIMSACKAVIYICEALGSSSQFLKNTNVDKGWEDSCVELLGLCFPQGLSV